MAQAYFSLVTTTGKIKLAESAAGGDPLVITHFAIGDGNGAETNPTAASTALVREVWRTPVESVVTDPDNPSAILVTAIIPTNAGGWWMREFGIFDQAGSMIAVAKPVSQYKPTALEGQLEDIRYEFQIIIGENANVTLLVDPSVLLATRAWVEARKIPMSQLMRLPWLPVISMTLSSPPGSPATGDTYLVPSNATGAWAANIGKIAEWSGSAWSYVTPPDGHGISLPDGRVFERVDGNYVEKLALDVQSGKWSYAVAGGAANVLTASLTPAPAAYTAGLLFRVMVTTTNTAKGPTLNLNGLGAKTIAYPDGTGVADGELVAGRVVELVYDGTKFILTNPWISFLRLSPRGARQTRGFTAGVALTDIATSVPTVAQTITVTGTTYLDCVAYCAFRNQDASLGNVTGYIRLMNGATTVATSDYLGCIGKDSFQIPITLRERFYGLDPAVTYTVQLIVVKQTAVGPMNVADPRILALHE